MNRNAAFLDLILRRAGRRKISRTRLLKLAYMADLLAWRVLGAPISEFRYRRYKQGPFDGEFYPAIEALLEAGRVETEEKTTITGNDCNLIRAVSGFPSPLGEFTRGQAHLIDLAINRYGSMKLPKFLEEVHRTESMKNIPFQEPLPMEEQKDKDREAAGGISLETILESREEISKGHGISLEELKKEILGANR